jgi:hypothetical protein
VAKAIGCGSLAFLAGKYVLVAGWLGHALWDLYHWRADKGVSRSFAEWCGVLDLLGAIAILAYPAT